LACEVQITFPEAMYGFERIITLPDSTKYPFYYEGVSKISPCGITVKERGLPLRTKDGSIIFGNLLIYVSFKWPEEFTEQVRDGLQKAFSLPPLEKVGQKAKFDEPPKEDNEKSLDDDDEDYCNNNQASCTIQ
jgi:DnaJ-class molecular chaperone